MELRMNFSSFVKLKDAIRIDNINGEIIEYNLINEELNGKLNVNGHYYKSSSNNIMNFNDEIPFTVMFANNNYEVNDVDCINLEYDFIDGRGIEVNFDIIISYEEILNEIKNDDYIEEDQSENNLLEIPQIEISNVNTDDLEEIKEKITSVFEQKLSTTLNSKDDNLPTEEVKVPLKEKRQVIKVRYYSDEKELEKICKDYQLSIESTLNTQHQNKRVIIQ